MGRVRKNKAGIGRIREIAERVRDERIGGLGKINDGGRRRTLEIKYGNMEKERIRGYP